MLCIKVKVEADQISATAPVSANVVSAKFPHAACHRKSTALLSGPSLKRFYSS